MEITSGSNLGIHGPNFDPVHLTSQALTKGQKHVPYRNHRLTFTTQRWAAPVGLVEVGGCGWCLCTILQGRNIWDGITPGPGKVVAKVQHGTPSVKLPFVPLRSECQSQHQSQNHSIPQPFKPCSISNILAWWPHMTQVTKSLRQLLSDSLGGNAKTLVLTLAMDPRNS